MPHFPHTPAFVLTLATLSAPVIAQDSDGDGVPDALDTCPRGDDTIDNYGNPAFSYTTAITFDNNERFDVSFATDFAGTEDLSAPDFTTYERVPSPDGMALQFSGDVDPVTVLIPDGPGFDTMENGSFTVMFNFRPAATQSGLTNNYLIVGKGGAPGDLAPFIINYSPETGSVSAFRIGVEANIYFTAVSATNNINDGNFHHIALTYDQSGSGLLELFVDGDSADTAAGPLATIAPTDAPITFATTYADGSGAPIAMELEDFFILETALTQPEIADIADNGLGNGIPDACDTPCPIDVNNDGILENGDISDFVTLFLAQDPAVDFNRDGLADNADIFIFVQLFIQGC